jgi:predicted transcriptional regulator YdeE
MAKNGEPRIITLDSPLYALGVGKDTSDTRIRKDAPELGARYARLRKRNPLDAVRPRIFVAATSAYDPTSTAYHYAMGDVVEGIGDTPEEMENIAIPAGLYAAFVVRPLLGFLWAPAIGKTYAYIYGSWLPKSPWRHDPREAGPGFPRVDHFEYHDERASRKRKPEMEIRVPIAPR